MTFEVMTGHRGICLDSTIERCAASCQSLVPVAESSMGEVVNTETDLGSHTGLLTPNERHFRRNNFPYPESWPGLLVEPGSRLSLSDLKRFETRELVVTLECAGNGRAFLDPPVPGEQWGLGAVSTARWGGAPLVRLLPDLPDWAVEIGFEGADGFVRSLPIEMARHPDVLLATTMNGEPLPPEHGGPVRLLVPGWYGMASVKWLTAIRALREPFQGHFQVERYVIDDRPVREMQVRAVITQAGPGQARGYAWSGQGAVSAVEVSDDGGVTWFPAELKESAPPYGWTRWEAGWKPGGSGATQLLARAHDSAGNRQPLEQVWNTLGYCNNAVRPYAIS